MSSDAPAHCPATREDLRLPDPWNGPSSWVRFKDANAWTMLTPRHHQPNLWPGHGQAENKEGSKGGGGKGIVLGNCGREGKGLMPEGCVAALFLTWVLIQAWSCLFWLSFQTQCVDTQFPTLIRLQIVNYGTEALQFIHLFILAKIIIEHP